MHDDDNNHEMISTSADSPTSVHVENAKGTDSMKNEILGPCPTCGRKTKSYGGGWACSDYRCIRSPESLVCDNGPAPSWWGAGIRVSLDGDAWCATGPGFVDIQQSPCGFGGTPDAAVAALRSDL